MGDPPIGAGARRQKRDRVLGHAARQRPERRGEDDLPLDGDAARNAHRAGVRRGDREGVEDGDRILGDREGAQHRAAGDEEAGGEQADERRGEPLSATG